MTVPLELESDNPAVVYLESLSKGSYWAVRHSLETIAAILAGEGTDPWTFPWETIRYQHTARVRREIIGRYAPATVNKMLSALRGVLKHAWRLGKIDHETYARAADVKNVRVRTHLRGRAVRPEELAALFAVCADDLSPAGRRDAAMLAVLYGGGLRRAELCGLDLTDFDAEVCSLTVRRGKGQQDRTVYLNSDACAYLAEWAEVRSVESGPLFCPVSSAGTLRLTRMRGETVWYILRRRQHAAGVEGVTPHGLRRSFVTGLLDAGVDVLTVQELAGHAAAATTARYDLRGEGAKRRATRALPLPSPA